MNKIDRAVRDFVYVEDQADLERILVPLKRKQRIKVIASSLAVVLLGFFTLFYFLTVFDIYPMPHSLIVITVIASVCFFFYGSQLRHSLGDNLMFRDLTYEELFSLSEMGGTYFNTVTFDQLEEIDNIASVDQSFKHAIQYIMSKRNGKILGIDYLLLNCRNLTPQVEHARQEKVKAAKKSEILSRLKAD